MSRISNLTKYPYDYNITEKDFVIGTNGDTNNKKTKNFPVVALAEYVRNFNNNLSYDRVISIGEITSENNNITINVNDLGNVVYINHTFYTKNTPDTFTFTPVTEGVKIILLYALPDEQIFYMLEGVQSIEAVEPTLPSGALFVQRIIVTVDGIEIIPSETLILDNKIQITETNSFANIGQSQKDFNKNVSDYKIASDLKNQEQDDRLTDIEGENATQYDLINDLSSELDYERVRNDAQDSRLENLEGINYVWSPTNRTLTLFDNNGTQLSQVSLVSLDNVLEFANLASFPTTGESGKIYIALDTNITYRWSGTGYAEISASLALGETANTAYRGDRGKIAYDHSQTTGNPHGTTATDVDALKRDGSNANSNINIGEFQLKAGQIELDQTPTQSFGVGMIRWNDTDGTAEIRLKGNNVTLQIGQELVKRVVNKSGANLLESQYKVVKIVGATGQRLSIDLAQANSELNSETTIGIVTENINNNQEGFITYSGEVNGINTTGSLQGETWADGDVLYLSPYVAGGITKIKPTAPNHIISVGYVEYSHAVNGKIFVKIDNGYELEELHNVTSTNYTTPIDTDSLLTFDVINSLWKRLTWENIKANLKTYFDSIYTTSSAVASQITTALAGYATQAWVNTGLETKQDKLQDTTGNIGVGKTDSSATEKLDVNGYTKAYGFKVAGGTATQSLTANGGTFDLTTKADLIGGKVPSSQLPAYVDDVLEFANLASFPATGESGKIYVSIDTNKTYRWSGTGYAEISASLALGETSSTAYRGDRGKIAFDHSETIGNPHGTTKADIGLGNVDNTSDINKPVSIATQTALDLKVDKVAGKQLSTEDYTTNEKNKLAGIQSGAEVNVNADWNSTSGDSQILNKPTLSEVALSGDYSDLNNIPTEFTPSPHSHVIGDVAELQTTLDGKQPIGDYLLDADLDEIRTDIETIEGDISTINSSISSIASELDTKVDKIIGKGLSTEDFTTSEKSKLAGIENGAEVNVNADWNAISGDAHILNKPSTFTPSAHTHPISQVDNLQTTLDGKESTISAGTTGQYWRGDKTWQTLNKSAVGLSNVDNTSDANKPISNATQSALNAKADLVNGVIPSSQLPSFVDDVLEFANFASFPATGESGKIYIAIDTNLTYRWSGTTYVEISPSLALGETSSTAYRGDRGKTAYDHSQTIGNPHGTTKGDIGLGNVPNADATNPANITQSASYRFVTDTEKATWNAKQNALTNPITGTGTTNYIPKFTASGTLGNSVIYDNGTNVGIGTINPIGILDIKDSNKVFNDYGNVNVFTTDVFSQHVGGSITLGGENGSGTTPYPFAKIQGYKENNTDGDGSGGLWFGTSPQNNLLFPRMTINYIGFVGINTTSPKSMFHVLTSTNKNINFVDAAHSTLTGLGSGISFSRSSDGTLNTSALFNALNGAAVLAGRTGVIFTTGGTTDYSATTERMRINSSGNVGIGTTTPSEKLDVNGYVKATGFKTINGTSTQFLMADGSTNSNTYAKTDGTNATGNWGISITGNATTATTASALGKVADYTWSASTAPVSYNIGMQMSFVQAANGWQSYGTVITTKAFDNGGSALQMYIPYSPTYGGNGLQVRFGNYDNSNAWTSWKTLLASDNYTDYTVSKTGSGASGTWGINITGDATNSTNSSNTLRVTFNDGPRDLSDRLPNTFARSVVFDFVYSGIVGGTGNYAGVMTFSPWAGTTASTGDSSYQLAFYNQTGINGSGIPGLKIRKGIDTTWNNWYKIYTDGDFSQSHINNWNTAFGWGNHASAGYALASGTVNYIPKFTASGTIGNSLIYDNGTNVGIGTTSPIRTLDVNGQLRVQTGIIDLGNSVDNQIWVGTNDINFKTNGSEKVIIKSSGKVGIGTSSPTTLLDVNDWATFLISSGNRLKIWDGTDNVPTISADNLLVLDSPTIQLYANDVTDSNNNSIYLKLKTINGNTTLDNSYHNKIVRITASCTITIPTNLRTDFNCTFEVIGAYTAQFVDASGVTTSAPFGRYLKTDLTAMFYCTGTASNYRLNGSLATS